MRRRGLETVRARPEHRPFRCPACSARWRTFAAAERCYGRHAGLTWADKVRAARIGGAA